MQLEPGARLGRYLVESPLGAGGMGEVWQARDAELDRRVAIKVLKPELSLDPDRVRRFAREARAAARLRHPNVLAVFDVGEHLGAPYLVTELLEGETLRARLERGALDPSEAVVVGRQIASALEAAHERAIVHRDLKPENVFLARSGEAKLLDFGIAKLLPLPVAPGDAGASTLSVTDSHGVIGTVGYMAPEQVLGRAVDRRADLFALGAILHEMVQGLRAFGGETPVERLAAILKESPPPVLADDRTSRAELLRRVIARCLEKDPAERYQDAREVVTDLDHIVREAVRPVEPTSAHRRARSSRAPAVGIAVALAGGVLAFVLGRATGSVAAPTSRHPTADVVAIATPPQVGEAPRFSRLTWGLGGITTARFSSDATTIAYGGFFGAEPLRVHLVRTDSTASRTLDIDGDVLAVSPRGEMAVSLGRRLAWWPAEGTLAVAPLMSGAPRPLQESVQDADFDAGGEELVVARSEGTEGVLERPRGTVAHRAPGWISNVRVDRRGERVAFVHHPHAGDSAGGVSVLERDGSVRQLSSGWMDVSGLAWGPTGEEVWFSGASQRGPYEIAAVDLRGVVRRVFQGPGRVVLHDAAPDGRLLATVDDLRAATLVQGAGGAPARDLSILDQTVVFALSRDGERALLSEQSAGGRPSYDVYLRPTDGRPPILLGEGLATSLSDDARWTVSLVPGKDPAVVILPTGAGTLRRARLPGLACSGARILGDGRTVVVRAAEGDAPERFYAFDAERATGPRPIGPGGSWAEWMPTADGRAIVARDSERQVWTLPVGGATAARRITELPPHHVLAGPGRGGRFHVLQRAARPGVVFDLDLASGELRRLFELAPTHAAGFVEVATFAAASEADVHAYTVFRQLSTLFVIEGLR